MSVYVKDPGSDSFRENMLNLIINVSLLLVFGVASTMF
jgi:hypothetical protein